MEKNIGICSMEKFDSRTFNSVGSSRIRVRWLLPYWLEAEEYVIGKKYDILIFQKVYWESFKKNGNFKGIKILDLCVSGDTLIYTKDGWKYITEVKLGDMVLTHKGRFRKVTRKFERFSKVKKVKASGLERLSITDNHPLWVSPYRYNGYGKRINNSWSFQPIKELTLSKRHKSGFYVASLKSEAKELVDSEQDLDLAYFLGYYMAEGTHGDHQVSFAMNKKETIVKEKILKVIRNLGFNPTYKASKDDGHGDVYFTSHKWVDYLRKNVGVSSNKRIPGWVFSLSNSEKVVFLGAYLNGDGYCLDVGGITSSSISKKLSFGIWKLYKDLGLKPQIIKMNRTGENCSFFHKNGKVYKGKEQWVVRLNPTESVKFIDMGSGGLYKKTRELVWRKNKSKNNEIVEVDGYDGHPIRKIEEGNEIPVYNLEVEDDNSYVADGYITHNCDADWLENRPVFEYIDWANATVTSTEPLAEYIRKLRPDALVKCIPDRIYLPEAIPVKKKHEGKLKKLVWFGYSQNFHYVYNTFEELIKRGIELTMISNSSCEPPLIYRGKIKVNNLPYNYDTINREIIKADAVLLPEPKGDERSKYKSNNKTLQSWALRMPVIKLPEDLDKFMSGEEREAEVTLRRKEVEEKWDSKLSVAEYKTLIDDIGKLKK